jgi:hypothetical protein
MLSLLYSCECWNRTSIMGLQRKIVHTQNQKSDHLSNTFHKTTTHGAVQTADDLQRQVLELQTA